MQMVKLFIFLTELLNELSEEAFVKKIITSYDTTQKRQRSKSVSFREPVCTKIEDNYKEENRSQHTPRRSRAEDRTSRSTSESRELNYREVQKERGYILEKVGFQCNRNSRYAQFLAKGNNQNRTQTSEKSNRFNAASNVETEKVNQMSNRGIINNKQSGILIPHSINKKGDSNTEINILKESSENVSENKPFGRKSLTEDDINYLDNIIADSVKRGSHRNTRGRGQSQNDNSLLHETSSPAVTDQNFDDAFESPRMLQKKTNVIDKSLHNFGQTPEKQSASPKFTSGSGHSFVRGRGSRKVELNNSLENENLQTDSVASNYSVEQVSSPNLSELASSGNLKSNTSDADSKKLSRSSALNHSIEQVSSPNISELTSMSLDDSKKSNTSSTRLKKSPSPFTSAGLSKLLKNKSGKNETKSPTSKTSPANDNLAKLNPAPTETLKVTVKNELPNQLNDSLRHRKSLQITVLSNSQRIIKAVGDLDDPEYTSDRFGSVPLDKKRNTSNDLSDSFSDVSEEGRNRRYPHKNFSSRAGTKKAKDTMSSDSFSNTSEDGTTPRNRNRNRKRDFFSKGRGRKLTSASSDSFSVTSEDCSSPKTKDIKTFPQKKIKESSLANKDGSSPKSKDLKSFPQKKINESSLANDDVIIDGSFPSDEKKLDVNNDENLSFTKSRKDDINFDIQHDSFFDAPITTSSPNVEKEPKMSSSLNETPLRKNEIVSFGRGYQKISNQPLNVPEKHISPSTDHLNKTKPTVECRKSLPINVNVTDEGQRNLDDSSVNLNSVQGRKVPSNIMSDSDLPESSKSSYKIDKQKSTDFSVLSKKSSDDQNMTAKSITESEKDTSIFSEIVGETKQIVTKFKPSGMSIVASSESKNSGKRYRTKSQSRRVTDTTTTDDESIHGRRTENHRRNFFSDKSNNHVSKNRSYNLQDTDKSYSDSSKGTSGRNSFLHKVENNRNIHENGLIENEADLIDDATPRCRISRLKTQHCLCDTCNMWRDTNEPFKSENETTQPPEPTKTKKTTKVKRSLSPLLRNEKSDEKIIVEDAAYSSIVDRFIAPKVLVHSVLKLDPVTRVAEAPFHPDIIRSLLELCYERSHRIQAYTWSSISRGQHTVIINGPKSGKTMAYIPPLCSSVLFSEDSNDVDTLINSGPLILVVVPGVLSGEYILSMMQKICRWSRLKPKIILANPPLSNKTKSDISRGLDILICTPKTLLFLLKEKITRLKRVQSVVLEDADELYQLFSDEIDSLLQLLDGVVEKRTTYNVQLIAVSKHWSTHLEKMIKRLHRLPTICVGAHLEAALYGRIHMNVKFVDIMNKDNYVKGLIEKNKKVVVICNDQEEVLRLNSELIDFNPLPLHEDSDKAAQEGVQTIWDSDLKENYRVLICDDFILNTSIFVNISDALIVIQYSLPESWTIFSKRFALFTKHYTGPFVKLKNETVSNFKMHVFLDEACKIQYEKMIALLQRFNCNLPPEIIDLCDNIHFEKEKQKIADGVEICSNLKLFGTCDDTENCTMRHLFNKDDTTTSVPQSGIIKLKILHIHNITNFAVRLIEHVDADGVVHEIKDKFAEIAIKLTRLTSENARKKLTDIEIGILCAIEESPKLFRRCKITNILCKNAMNLPTKVQVKLLDVGAILDVSAYELYMLPLDDLYDIPPQAVEVYIADMGPPEKDKNWSNIASIRLQKMLKQAGYEEPNCYFTGRIKLQLANTLWVNNLILREFAPDGSLQVHKLSARTTLLRTDLAEDRPGQLDNLYKICTKSGIQLPDYSLPVVNPVKETPPQVKPMWAHLENGEEYNMVYFCSADNPERFFIRICKHQSSFDALVDEIQATIKQPLYPTEFEVLEGRCYLAKDPQGDQYGRVIVNKIEDDVAHCFFVDHGDYITVNKSDLKFLTDELITKLPFQVIECKLYGLQPLEKFVDGLYDYAFEPDSDLLRFLHVKIMTKETADVTEGKKYSVILIDLLDGNNIINNIFLNIGLAEKVIDNNFEDEVNFEKLKINTAESEQDNDIDSDKEYTLEEVQEMSKKYNKNSSKGETFEYNRINENNTGSEHIEEIINNPERGSSEVSFDIHIDDFFQFIKDGYVVRILCY